MSEQYGSAGVSATLTRTFAWPPEKVFDAWTKPEWFVQWMRLSDADTAEADIDLKIGGRYRFVIRNDGGKEFFGQGVYREIERPHRLVFTWKWDSSPVDQGESLVTVILTATPVGTQMTLIHERLQSEMSAEAHTQGWNGCLDRLEALAEGT